MRRFRVALAIVVAVAAAPVPGTAPSAASPESPAHTPVDNAEKVSYPPAMVAPPNPGGVGVGEATRAKIDFVRGGGPLGGYRLGYLPPGLTPMGADSEYTAVVTPAGLTGDVPAPGE